MTLPPIVPGQPPDQQPPPPQVVYVPVYQQPPPQAQQVTKGIWDFLFQWWFVLGVIVAFFAVCCVAVAIIGTLNTPR